MTIFVDITPACEQEARNCAQYDSIVSIAQKIEKQQSIANLDKHLPSPIVKKVVGKTFRLYGIELLQEHTGHRVIRFAKFFVKGQHEDYHHRLEEEAFRNKFIEEAAFGEDDLDAFIQKRIDAGVKGLMPLSELEAGYLDIATAALNQSAPSIYETLDWVELLKSSKMTEFRWSLAAILQDLVVSTKKEDRTAATRYPADRNQRGVLYRQFQNGLLLVAPVGFPEGPREDDLRARYAEVFSAGEALAEEELRKFSLRTYPEFVLVDDTLWVNLQKAGKEANLSLSPEELGLLHTLLTPGEMRNPYPLFINGRPGSGKTTILHYLFAEHLHHHLTTKEPLGDPPLYLTYSPALTERAKETVSTILACDYRRLEDPPDMDSGPARATINRAFSGFRDMLLSLLDEEVRVKYHVAQYVDFPEFRKLWVKSVAQDATRPADLRNSPELAWHAIRTFIKGRRPADGQGDDFSPDLYAELPKRQKSIDEDLYGQIYKSIWHGWYKPRCERDGLWDDQDLALEVLRLEDGLARYPAIVCDEAQDFTSNELAVILRLSLFSARDVPHYLLGRIPFAFAGDPFQTLNPTGFDWNALSDSFRENLLRELDPTGRHQLQVNFRELEFNYRSTEPIVRLCNLIQLLRGILFEVGGLKPQQTWRNEVAPDPALFDIAEAATRDALRRADDVVFIVPSQEETEVEYVQADEQLSRIALADGKLSRDVFNPMRAKGMEFGRVVIYKFGDYCLRRFSGLPALLGKPEPQAKRNRDRLAYEYFLNRLYVALSRARGRLLIVDTGEAIEKFWRFARGQGYEDLIGQYKTSGGAWELANLGLAINGEMGAWQEDVLDDSADIGRQFFDNGYDNRDPYLLERAASRFDRVGDESNALKARAWACHFREDFTQAGRIFARIPDVPHALDNYWLAGEYADFVNLARNKGVAGDPRFHASRYMGSHRQEEDARAFFATLNAAIADSSGVAGVADKRMREVLDAAFGTLLARLDAAPSDDRAQAAARGDHAHVASVSMRLDWTPHPSIGYAVLTALGGHGKAAAEIWKATRRPDAEVPEVLLPALANAAMFPENLSYLRRLQDFDGILAATHAGDRSKISAKVVAGIGADLRGAGDAERFEKFALALRGTKAFAVFDDIPVDELSADARAHTLAAKLITRLAETGELGELRAFLSCVVVHSVPDMAKDKQAWLGTVVSNAPDVHCTAIRALAAANIVREQLDIQLKDRIEQYFDGLLKVRNKDLGGISPFEVGSVLELSGKYRLMQQYYELVLKSCDRHTDRAIVEFAHERLVFANVGLAQVTNQTKVRRRIEEQYKRSAREWSIDLAHLPLTINLHGYHEAIERFYEERQVGTVEPVAKNVPELVVLPPEGGAAIASITVETPPLLTKPLATAMGLDGSRPQSANIKTTQAGGGQALEAVELTESAKDSGLPVGGSRRKADEITVRANEIMLDVICDYEVRRIDIRNLTTRDTVVVKMKNGVPSIGSADFDVSRSEHGVYHLGDWPVTVTVSEIQEGDVVADVQVLGSGPGVRLRI